MYFPDLSTKNQGNIIMLEDVNTSDHLLETKIWNPQQRLEKQKSLFLKGEPRR